MVGQSATAPMCGAATNHATTATRERDERRDPAAAV